MVQLQPLSSQPYSRIVHRWNDAGTVPIIQTVSNNFRRKHIKQRIVSVCVFFLCTSGNGCHRHDCSEPSGYFSEGSPKDFLSLGYILFFLDTYMRMGKGMLRDLKGKPDVASLQSRFGHGWGRNDRPLSVEAAVLFRGTFWRLSER
ncbi:unnamed protein product [Ixodes pacificus]